MKGEIFLKDQVKYITTKQLIIAIIFDLSLLFLIDAYLVKFDVKAILELAVGFVIIILFWYIVSCLVEWIYYKFRKRK